MRIFLLLIVIFFSVEAFCQNKIPEFLVGTWKIENVESYEHWDKINDRNMKGFSYTLEDKIFKITEDLAISQVGNTIKYMATVLDQNNGNTIDFTMTQSENVFIFENPEHDFPKIIKYQKLSKNDILVEISDGKKKAINYKLVRQ